jgi:DNA repair protein RadD
VVFDELTEIATTADLTAQGYLVPARYFSIAEPDLRGVHTVAGDYQQDELAARMSPLVGDIPRTWMERAPGRRTVVFATTVKHSVALRDAFLVHGVAAEHVDGTTPQQLRLEIFDRFISGQTQVLCNCMLATMGFDLPELDCVVLARPTKSLVLYLQMLGRGLRIAPGKQNCLVLDHSGAVHRHGFATDPRAWSLDGHANLDDERRAAIASATPKQITCPRCACVFHSALQCPECGHFLERRGKDVPTLPGELVEIGDHEIINVNDRMRFHAELRAIAGAKSFKAAWAAHKYREKFGSFPPWRWNTLPTVAPSLTTERWVQSRYIAWRKATGGRS